MTNLPMRNSIMKIIIYCTIHILCIALAITSVNAQDKGTSAKRILKKMVKAHGGMKYNNAHYLFQFRDNVYRFKNSKSGYLYSVLKTRNNQQIYDQLTNGSFTRTVNGLEIVVGDKEQQAAINALNSVVYFATLPHKLLDSAVNISYAGDIIIKLVDYHILKVTFNKEGGGEDHDDQFMYWVRKDNSRIDYLAYNYQVNGGGVRFRSAYNTRNINGILFQDYINYKAEVGTNLAVLPTLYERNSLKELSRIVTTQVVKLK